MNKRYFFIGATLALAVACNHSGNEPTPRGPRNAFAPPVYGGNPNVILTPNGQLALNGPNRSTVTPQHNIEMKCRSDLEDISDDSTGAFRNSSPVKDVKFLAGGNTSRSETLVHSPNYVLKVGESQHGNIYLMAASKQRSVDSDQRSEEISEGSVSPINYKTLRLAYRPEAGLNMRAECKVTTPRAGVNKRALLEMLCTAIIDDSSGGFDLKEPDRVSFVIGDETRTKSLATTDLHEIQVGVRANGDLFLRAGSRPLNEEATDVTVVSLSAEESPTLHLQRIKKDGKLKANISCALPSLNSSSAKSKDSTDADKK